MAKSIEQEQGRQPAGNLWTNIGASAVNTINAATQELENLSPSAKTITRRSSLLGIAAVVVVVAGWEYQRQSNEAYKRKLGPALAAWGMVDALIVPPGEMVNLPEGEIKEIIHKSGKRIFLVNLSRYGILYDKRAIDLALPYAEARSSVVLFRSGVVPPVEFFPNGTNSMEKEYSVLASKQRIPVLPNSGYHQANIDDVTRLIRGNIDLSGLSEIEKEALGIRVGIGLSSGLIPTMRYLGFNTMVNRGIISRESVDYKKTAEERDNFERQLFELIRTGQLRPIFRVVFR